MSDDEMQPLQFIKQYHCHRDSLYHPERGPSIFGLIANPSLDCVCAELARLAYTRFEKNAAAQARLAQILAIGGFGQPACFNSEGSQAFAVKAKDGRQFVSFRGTQTDDLTDVIHDAECIPMTVAGYRGMVHWGFEKALQSIWPQVQEWLAANASPQPPVFSGHSLGAALATLAAARVTNAELITFGSPRVGNEEFAASFAGRVVRRYVDCCDGVTLVPLETGWGYKHVGLMTYIDRDGKLQQPLPSPRAIEQDKLLGHVWFATIDVLDIDKVRLREFADHAPANYIRALI